MAQALISRRGGAGGIDLEGMTHVLTSSNSSGTDVVLASVTGSGYFISVSSQPRQDDAGSVTATITIDGGTPFSFLMGKTDGTDDVGTGLMFPALIRFETSLSVIYSASTSAGAVCNYVLD